MPVLEQIERFSTIIHTIKAFTKAAALLWNKSTILVSGSNPRRISLMAKRKRGDKTDTSDLTNGSRTHDAAKVDSKSNRVSKNGTTKFSRPNGVDNRDVTIASTSPKSSLKNSRDQSPAKIRKTEQHVDVKTEFPAIQIVTGSYERVLHGITATISFENEKFSTNYVDSFLFNAHASAIRCLALSPMPEDSSQGVYLATGGSDERINVYSLSAAPMPEVDSKGRKVPTMPSLGANVVSENPMNRELGTLVQHSSNITSLHFPSRSKLLSGSEDNTISITRVRDMEVISTVKAPKPKVSGQASGDSASAGTVPAGVNDFAVHPSMKLMVSVSRGERCMRLWNLVTGKKAGVLNFDKEILQAVKEGKYSHGEGRRINWNQDGTEFAIAFERGVVVFGQDSKAKCVLLPSQLTKVHQVSYFTVGNDREFLAVSTENGRILFFQTRLTDPSQDSLPVVHPFAHTGGPKHGIQGRIKDFSILDLKDYGFDGRLIVVGCSDGNVKMISITHKEVLKPTSIDGFVGTASATSYSTASRITCLAAFVMLPAHNIEGGLSDAESGLDSSQGEESSDEE